MTGILVASISKRSSEVLFPVETQEARMDQIAIRVQRRCHTSS